MLEKMGDENVKKSDENGKISSKKLTDLVSEYKLETVENRGGQLTFNSSTPQPFDPLLRGPGGAGVAFVGRGPCPATRAQSFMLENGAISSFAVLSQAQPFFFSIL